MFFLTCRERCGRTAGQFSAQPRASDLYRACSSGAFAHLHMEQGHTTDGTTAKNLVRCNKSVSRCAVREAKTSEQQFHMIINQARRVDESYFLKALTSLRLNLEISTE